jgi:chromosomal replication initiation ATPase DnaA
MTAAELIAGAERLPVCDDCGELRMEIEVLGQVHNVRVACRHQEAAGIEAQAVEARKQAGYTFAQRFGQPGISPLSGRTFGELAKGPGLEAAEAWAVEWPRQRRDTGRSWLILQGGVGAGKTTIAKAIARRVVADHWTVVLIEADRLLSELSDKESTAYAACCAADLLILDDLGMGHSAWWTVERLASILHTRYERGLPVVVTSNHDKASMTRHWTESAKGDETAALRVISRIYDGQRSVVVDCGNVDRRAQR